MDSMTTLLHAYKHHSHVQTPTQVLLDALVTTTLRGELSKHDPDGSIWEWKASSKHKRTKDACLRHPFHSKLSSGLLDKTTTFSGRGHSSMWHFEFASRHAACKVPTWKYIQASQRKLLGV